jgi:hypothetical protein
MRKRGGKNGAKAWPITAARAAFCMDLMVRAFVIASNT